MTDPAPDTAAPAESTSPLPSVVTSPTGLVAIWVKKRWNSTPIEIRLGCALTRMQLRPDAPGDAANETEAS